MVQAGLTLIATLRTMANRKLNAVIRKEGSTAAPAEEESSSQMEEVEELAGCVCI